MGPPEFELNPQHEEQTPDSRVNLGIGATQAGDEADLFELAFRHAGIGMALVGLDGRWMKVNDTLCGIVGYGREELLQLDFQSITHPADLDADLEFVRRLLAGELQSYDLEKRYLKKSGEAVWIHLTATLVRSSVGQPRFFIAQIHDVTRRRNAESEIEAFFEASPDLLAIAGGDGALSLVNSAWERVLGWTKAELTTRPFMEFVHPEDRERTAHEADMAYRGLGAPSFRNRYLTNAGDYRWLEWNSRQLPDGRLYCVVRDVTARVADEEAKQWLAALVECSGDAVVGVDATAHITSWNAGAERLFGYSASEMLGKSGGAMIPEGEPNLPELLSGAPADQNVFKFETRRRRKDGSWFDAHLTLSRVRGRQGESLGWCGISRDVTEEKARRTQLARQIEIYAAIVRSLPRGAVCMFDRDLMCVAVEGAEKVGLLRSPHGAAPGNVVGHSLIDVAPTGVRLLLLAACRSALGGESTEREVEVEGRTLLLRSAPVYAAGDKQIAGALILTLDVHDAVLQRQELTRTKLLLEATFFNIRDGVALLDERRRVVLANAAYDEMLGLPRGGSLGMGPTEMIAHVVNLSDDPELTQAIMVPTPEREQERSHELLLNRPVRRWIRRTLAAIGTDQERRYLVLWRDVTLERDLFAAREREVLTDPLTCIPNRRAAEAALVRELSRVGRGVSAASIVVFDIDHFKRVNDQHGHPMGDAVLCQVARMMSELARDTDCVARWGGEEFVAVLVGDVKGAQAFAERVRAVVSESEFPAGLAITLSAGVTQCRIGEPGAQAVARADRALYDAKAQGRNRVIGL